MPEMSIRRVWPPEEAGPIRGQQSSMFFASDQKPMSYFAYPVTIYHCGKCFINLPEEIGWPRMCAKGHVNELR